MISLVGFLLVLGLIIFGPKKTIEFAQEIGRLLTQLKHATGQFQQSALAPVREPVRSASKQDSTLPEAPME
jgi:Sec-independent protein translocase protein TatA